MNLYCVGDQSLTLFDQAGCIVPVFGDTQKAIWL